MSIDVRFDKMNADGDILSLKNTCDALILCLFLDNLIMSMVTNSAVMQISNRKKQMKKLQCLQCLRNWLLYKSKKDDIRR